MPLGSSFRGFHVHLPAALTDVLEVLAPFAFLAALAVLASRFAPWS